MQDDASHREAESPALTADLADGGWQASSARKFMLYYDI